MRMELCFATYPDDSHIARKKTRPLPGCGVFRTADVKRAQAGLAIFLARAFLLLRACLAIFGTGASVAAAAAGAAIGAGAAAGAAGVAANAPNENAAATRAEKSLVMTDSLSGLTTRTVRADNAA